MRMPNPERALVAIEKLRDYCLSPEHPRGRHKARVFSAALGFTTDKAEDLKNALLTAAQADTAVPGNRDQYGQRYVLDFPLEGLRGKVTIRSTWIVRTAEDYPRLTSCYVLEEMEGRG
jgi:hypothetical protein